MGGQRTWLIVLIALCSLHLIKANTPNSLTDNEKKVKTKVPLADDLRYNKMLPDSKALKDDGKNSTEDDYYDDYYTDYDDEIKVNKLDEGKKKSNSTATVITSSVSHPSIAIGKLKPIKGDDKVSRYFLPPFLFLNLTSFRLSSQFFFCGM